MAKEIHYLSLTHAITPLMSCHVITSPLIRINPGSIFGWGLIFIFGGLGNLFFKF
jgi:hypothetical protein